VPLTFEKQVSMLRLVQNLKSKSKIAETPEFGKAGFKNWVSEFGSELILKTQELTS
jgi:hypothetical protein